MDLRLGKLCHGASYQLDQLERLGP